MSVKRRYGVTVQLVYRDLNDVILRAPELSIVSEVEVSVLVDSDNDMTSDMTRHP